MRRQTRRAGASKTGCVDPLESTWAREYQGWYSERFNEAAPAVSAESGPDGTTYTAELAYGIHVAPTANFKHALSAVKSTLPREVHYNVGLCRVDGQDTAQLSHMSTGMEVMSALAQFREGTKVKVKVEGGVGGEWRDKAGFVFANMLGDVSFNYELELPIPLEKWDRLASIIEWGR
ncbi:MAG: hypothetical protein ABH834_02620 [Candidatus Altiarchaeota archaeon]